MLKKQFSTCRNSTDRYVPTNKAYRICRFVSAALVFSSLVFSKTNFKTGDAAELKSESDLRIEAKIESKSLGKLPPGTLVNIKGENKDGFTKVSVDLIDGTIEGWVEESIIKVEVLKENTTAPSVVTSKNEKSVDTKSPAGKKRRIPKDEALLLRRGASFYYGVDLGLAYNIINSTTSPDLYVGTGYQANLLVGFYLNDFLRLGGEIGYTKISGSDPNSISPSFGIFNLNAKLDFLIERRFLASLGLGYGFGAGLSGVPTNFPVQASSEVNSPWIYLGAGYRLGLTDLAHLSFLIKYGYSFLRDPVGMQYIGLNILLEFEG